VALQQRFIDAGLPAPQLAPMIRGRLVAINDKPVRPSALADEQARRLAEREFNLSWRDSLPDGNRWWPGNGGRKRPGHSFRSSRAWPGRWASAGRYPGI
jgi:predicted lysophospholipase L1 biosynthesis ABC-type transport system permease subunit